MSVAASSILATNVRLEWLPALNQHLGLLANDVLPFLDDMASSVSELAASGPFVSEVLRCRLYVTEGIEVLHRITTSAPDEFDTDRLGLATHSTALCLRSIRHRLVCDVMAADDPAKMLTLKASSSLITAALQLDKSPIELQTVKPWDRLGIYVFPTLLSFKDWAARTDQIAGALYDNAPAEYRTFVAETELAFKNFSIHYTCFTKVYVKLLLGKQKRRVEANTALSAAGLLFAGTVAQTGNSKLFSASDSPTATGQVVQIFWTISLAGSIFSALLAAAAAYWHNSAWSKSRSDGRISHSTAVLHLFYVYGPLSTLLLSILTFFAGLCASPIDLGFSVGVKATTLAVSVASIAAFTLLVWMTLDDELVRPAGVIHGLGLHKGSKRQED